MHSQTRQVNQHDKMLIKQSSDLDQKITTFAKPHDRSKPTEEIQMKKRAKNWKPIERERERDKKWKKIPNLKDQESYEKLLALAAKTLCEESSL